MFNINLSQADETVRSNYMLHLKLLRHKSVHTTQSYVYIA